MFEKFFNNNINNEPFLRYKGTILSREDFIENINNVCIELDALKNISTKHFVFIKDENPLVFFVVLMALWKKGFKVHFPNKFYLERNLLPDVCKYVISWKDKLNIVENKGFVNISLPDNADSIVFSSGSTGEPKGIVHSKETFIVNALDTAEQLNQKYVQSITFLKPYLVSSLSHFFVHWYQQSMITYENFNDIANLKQYAGPSKLGVIGSPVQIIQSIKVLSENNIIPDYMFSSGDVIYASIIEKILNIFPDIFFYKVYGLAEVGGRLFVSIITNNAHDKDDIGNILKSYQYQVEKDEIVVCSEWLYLGYLIENKFIKHEKCFKTGDKIKKLRKGRMKLIGRSNDEIKVAGNKVSINVLEEKILNALNNDFNINIATVVPVPHNIYGNMIALVFESSKTLKSLEIYNSLRAHSINNYELPHEVYKVKNIPYTQTMKIDRKKIQLQVINRELDAL